MEAVILAAGKSKRIKSKLSKVLHYICGKPVIFYVVEALKSYKTHIVVNNNIAENIRKEFSDVEVHIQEKLNGTASALKSAIPFINDSSFIAANGDTPLIRKEDIDMAKEIFEKKHPDCLVLTARLDNPHGYGRIIRKENGIEIIEEKDADENIKQVKEVNTGIYVLKTDFAKSALMHIMNNNANGEYYLTDIAKLADRIETVEVDAENILGINTRKQLTVVRKKIQERIIDKFDDVTFIDPDSTYINYDVKIGSDTIIFPNVSLRGLTSIGKQCIIDTGSVIENSAIGENVHIKPYSVIENSVVGNSAQIGPFAHLRPLSEIKDEVRIGNFVEVKKSVVGRGSKASHLTYIGDAQLGEDVNVGCGTITCNYDGYRKNRTIIGDRVFIGSDVQLVAPVEIEHDALIAAGTTVTKNVDAYSLTLSRVPQVNKKNWVKKYRKDMERKMKK